MGISEFNDLLLQQLASAGLPALLMAIAVWWLQKSNSNIISAYNKERSERLDMMEQHMRSCDEDRRRISDKLSAVSDRMVDMAHQIGELKAANFSLAEKRKNPKA